MWYYSQNDQQKGPIRFEALRSMVLSGDVSRVTLVWKEGMPAWTQAGQTPEFSGLFGSNPPPMANKPSGPPPLNQDKNSFDSHVSSSNNDSDINIPSHFLGEYMIRRKFMTIAGAKFHVYDRSGSLVAFSRQKAFKLKEDIRVYSNESENEEIFMIKARNIIDFGAAYDVFDSKTNTLLGTWKRKGFSSLVRDSWKLDSAKFNAVLKEDSIGLALLRRFLLGWLLPQDYHLLIHEKNAVQYTQNFNPFIYKLNVKINTPLSENFTNLFLAGGILLAAIEGKQSIPNPIQFLGG